MHFAVAPVQSEAASQTVMPGDGHDAAQTVPVKAVHSGHVMPQWVAVVGLPVPQHTGPAAAPTQSMASRHCQSTEPVTGHAVPAGSQVEGDVAPSGTSQQCWPAAHVTLLPPLTPLKGQKTPAFVSGKSFGGASHVPVLLDVALDVVPEVVEELVEAETVVELIELVEPELDVAPPVPVSAVLVHAVATHADAAERRTATKALRLISSTLPRIRDVHRPPAAARAENAVLLR